MPSCLDVMPPRVNGIAVLQPLAGRRLQVPVAAVSANRALLRDAVDVGAADRLGKPCDLDRPSALVARHCRPGLVAS